MNNRKKILYMHHGHARGGAFLSLLYFLRALDKSLYEPIVCNSGDEQDIEVEKILKKEGFQTCACRLPRFSHTTSGAYSLFNIWSLRQLYSWMVYYSKAKNDFKLLLDYIKPDIVHFNSLTLAPYAKVPYKINIRTVVHVREAVLDGLFGIRKRWLRKSLEKYAYKVIAICHDNVERLNLPKDKVCVIYNPVDFNKFNYLIDKSKARIRLGIADAAPVVLYAGGSIWEAKGLLEFLSSMQIVKKKYPKVVCLMPGFSLPFDPGNRVWTFKRRIANKLGLFQKQDKLFYLYKSENLNEAIIRMDFVYDIENWIAASDVVCVPHMQPHFSRTVMEAGAMKKPIAVFRIGGIEEVVINSKTGLMVERGDVEGLADALIEIIENKELSLRLGLGGYIQALDLFDAHKNSVMTMNIYNELMQYKKKIHGK